MASLAGLTLDPDVPESGSGFVLLPPGKYAAVINKDELKSNSKQNGKLLVLSLQITEGEFTGVEVVDRLNLLNPSVIAQKIGQGTLKRICGLCNVPYPPNDSRVLWGVPLTITVKNEEYQNASGETVNSNKITGYNKASDTPVKVSPLGGMSENMPDADSGW